MSEVEIIFDELKKRDYSSWNIVSLLTRAQVLSLEEPQLATLMSGAAGSNDAYSKFIDRMQQITTLLNNTGLLVLGKDGRLNQNSASFGGISDVYHEFMKDLAAACDEPYEWLFGREGGLGSGMSGPLQQHYDGVERKRETDYQAPIDQLLPVIAMSTWGQVPDDLDWQWRPIRTMSDAEQAEIAQSNVVSITTAYQADLLTKKEARQELKSTSEKHGLFSNITDEALEATPDTYASESMGSGESDLQVPGGEEESQEETPQEPVDFANPPKPDAHPFQFNPREKLR
jgi:phage-related protein (TIGR01555 family)